MDNISVIRRDGKHHSVPKNVALVKNDSDIYQLEDKIQLPRSDKANFDLRNLEGLVVDIPITSNSEVSLRAPSTDTATIDVNRRDGGLHDVMPMNRNSIKLSKGKDPALDNKTPELSNAFAGEDKSNTIRSKSADPISSEHIFAVRSDNITQDIINPENVKLVSFVPRKSIALDNGALDTAADTTNEKNPITLQRRDGLSHDISTYETVPIPLKSVKIPTNSTNNVFKCVDDDRIQIHRTDKREKI